MEPKTVVLGWILALVVVGLAESDTAKDREKCGNQLIGLATCLPYVSGESKAPPPDCCTGFRQVLKDSRECVCLLIKDRDDPSLGLKINATLALSLPAKCNAPLDQSVSDCPAILHLPPHSPDAKVFEDFANSANKTNSPSIGSARVGPRTAAAAAGQNSTGGGVKTRLFDTQMVLQLFVAVAAVHALVIL